jgi:O-antigen/teichoic acid export membrane protein
MFKSLLRLTKQSLIYGVGHILNRTIGFLLFPIHTNFIIPEEMGIVAIIFLFLGIMNVICLFGFNTAFVRYFALTKNESDKKNVFSNVFFSVLTISCIILTIVFFLRYDISKLIFGSYRYSNLFLICIGILICDTLSQITLLTFRVEGKSIKFTIFVFFNIIVNIFMNILFVIYLKKGITGIFISNLISSSFIFFLLIPTILKYLKLYISFNILKELASFGVPYVISGLCTIIMDLADRFILDRLVDLKTVGIYNAGYKLGTIMGLVVAGFRFAWHPFFLSISDKKDAKRIYARVMTYFIFISGLIFILISFFLQYVLTWKIAGLTILGPKYLNCIVILPWIMLAYVIYGIYCNLVVGIYIKKKSYIMPVITGTGALFNIIGNYLLIPYYGMIGAAIVTAISYFVMVIYLYIYIRRFYLIQYEYIRILKLIFLFSTVFFVGFFYNGSHLLVLRITLIIVIPLLLYLFKFFDDAEKKRLKQLFVIIRK